MATTPSYAFEDFPAGRVLEFGGCTVRREDVLRFAAEFDPQPFHLDEVAAERSLFGGLSASGWHTCAIVMRMNCDAWLLDSTSLGSPGIESLKWTLPVRPGDTLHVRLTVLEARPMRSRPEVGLVRSRWQVFNQREEQVMEMEGWGMFGRRESTAASAG
ncbi:MAG: MaoC family dehydratase [Betaproteobacteria bacterium]